VDKKIASCFVGLLCAALPALAAKGLDWDTATPHQIALRCNGADVWRFRFDPAKQTKPYFDPVCVAGGPSLTWARPPDHVWHYGLWFSWKYINGLNYWEEKGGRAEGETFWDPPMIETQPDGRAVISGTFGYRPSGSSATPLLRERRSIAISAPDTEGAYCMDWTLTFAAGDVPVTLDRTPLSSEPGGQAWGGYAGLSLRFAQSFSNVETVASTVGRVPRDAFGRLDVTAGAAEQDGLVGGRPYGIAMLSHPSNPRAPGDWYPIEGKSFNYLNAAFLLKSAYTLKAGETLQLRYRVQIHPERWSAEDLRLATERYVASAGAADKVRVLLLTGANNHNWQETTAALKALFAESPTFLVKVVEHPWEMKPGDIDGYDLIVNNWNTYGKDKREWSDDMKAAFMAWVKKGGGFFVLHAGGSMFYDWDEFQALTGGAWEKSTFHPHIQAFTVNITDKGHPVTRGMQDFETVDEPWQKIANRNPRRRVLMTGVVSQANGGSGEPEPFAFVTEIGKGRCFNLMLGHDVKALSNAGCRTLILRGAEWAATGGVKAKAGQPRGLK